MVQSRDETAKEWLLRVVRNVGTTVPIAEQQRACRSIFLSGLQDEYRYRLVDLLPIELHELATKLDAAFDARLETRARLNVPGYPRPVARMLK
ncbi:unnamed protein product [Schistocephalus solidus]|uniref:NepR domain-containing protein n=1 Tax=Schistocephalus solidus TaxID=70667 RepID=A0A183SPF4_SCHSO|nr:unnamed protein product [Schistocephalus solidus]